MRSIASAIAATALMFASHASAADSSPAAVLAKLKQLFEKKTLVGTDGATNRYSALIERESMFWFEVNSTLADGGDMLFVETLISVGGKALLILSVPDLNSNENYDIALDDAGKLVVTPRPADRPGPGLVTRVCDLDSAGKTFCEAKVRDADGVVNTTTYSQKD